MFSYMKIIAMRAEYECLEDGLLPAYLGSTIRGILGHCIHAFYCKCENTKCFLCEEKEICLYAQCFSNTGGVAGAVNPYVLYHHGPGKEKWEKGDHCVFDLTLFGKGAEHAGIYLDALIAAEQKGWGARQLPFRLLQITDPDSQRLIYGAGKVWLRNLNPRKLSIDARNATYACLTFDTPLRIVSSGELFQSLPFDRLIRFLIRRILLITTKYTDTRPEWDIEEILTHAAAVNTVAESWREIPFTRYSMNQKDKKLALDSRMGWILYEGDLSRFVPILEAGKYIRVGKGATIGFGHYDISYDI